jgi:periplasmic protein CpxP/Spy
MYKRLLTIMASGLLVLGVGLCGVSANAQEPPAGGEHMGQRHRMTPDEELSRLDKSLKLNDDQKSQIKPILEDRHKKMEDLRSDTSLSREDRMGKMRSIMEESNGKIRNVLNDDQKKQFDEMQQHMRGRGPGGHGPGGATPPPAPQQ